MTNTAVSDDVLVGGDPGQPLPTPAWAADEAVDRGPALRTLLSGRSQRDTQHLDSAPHRMAVEHAQRKRAQGTAVEAVPAPRAGRPVMAERVDGVPALVVVIVPGTGR